MSSSSDLPPGLGPWCVGVRVVVRRRLPGLTGPTGGPAMTDLLGVMESWDDDTVTVRDESGSVTVIERRLIVSGKPVPPRPSVRSRLSADEVAIRAAASWPALEVQHVGDWLLRASAGFSLRGNSALLAGDPGTPVEEALASVVSFYEARGLPPQAQVVVASTPAGELQSRGWTEVMGEVDVEVRLAGVAQVSRAVRRGLRGAAPAVRIDDHATDDWLAPDHRALAHLPASSRVLEGPGDVAFASVVGDDGRVVAKGRAALGERGEVWAGLTDLWVDPARRREGLASTVIGELLAWAAERGATTAYLQTTTDNAPALALYGRLGFVTHHRYHYLRAPHLPS